MKKIIVRLLIVLALAGVGAVVVATPASAAWSACPASRICTWDQQGGNGNLYYYTPSSYGWGQCVNIGGSWNDNVYSIRNRSDVSVWFYVNANCTGGLYSPPAGPASGPIGPGAQVSWPLWFSYPGLTSFKFNYPA